VVWTCGRRVLSRMYKYYNSYILWHRRVPALLHVISALLCELIIGDSTIGFNHTNDSGDDYRYVQLQDTRHQNRTSVHTDPSDSRRQKPSGEVSAWSRVRRSRESVCPATLGNVLSSITSVTSF
jgi:hypothetical protein